MDNDYDVLYKILLVGDSGVGKSSLLLRFTEDNFSETFISTIGVDFRMRIVEIGGKRYKLQIWDTAGQERFRTITGSYYRGAHGILLVYDVNSLPTFEHISTWMSEIDRNTSALSRRAVRILIGNKVDKGEEFRAVSPDRGKRVAEDNGMRFMEVSAKTNFQVESMFSLMVSTIAAEEHALLQKSQHAETGDGALLLDKPNPDGASCC